MVVAQNGSQYVFNTGGFSVCLLVSTKGLESTAWRTCGTPTLVAELVEAEGEGRKRASCCSPKGSVEMSNDLRKQQGQD